MDEGHKWAIHTHTKANKNINTHSTSQAVRKMQIQTLMKYPLVKYSSVRLVKLKIFIISYVGKGMGTKYLLPCWHD